VAIYLAPIGDNNDREPRTMTTITTAAAAISKRDVAAAVPVPVTAVYAGGKGR
jgi:hypothetical protein